MLIPKYTTIASYRSKNDLQFSILGEDIDVDDQKSNLELDECLDQDGNILPKYWNHPIPLVVRYIREDDDSEPGTLISHHMDEYRSKSQSVLESLIEVSSSAIVSINIRCFFGPDGEVTLTRLGQGSRILKLPEILSSSYNELEPDINIETFVEYTNLQGKVDAVIKYGQLWILNPSHGPVIMYINTKDMEDRFTWDDPNMTKDDDMVYFLTNEPTDDPILSLIHI